MQVITIDKDTGKRVYTQTIRLWEDAKVIPPSVRDNNDYRYWSEEDVEKIRSYSQLPAKERRKK